MTVEEIEKYILKYKSEGLKMFTTSSFQTHSIVLLHILSKIDNTIPVYFINTGFLFPETVAYKDTIKNAFGLNVIDVLPSTPKLMQKDNQGKFLFTSDPDYCCYINKVLPMEPLLLENDVWINGVRADQSAVRKGFNIEEKAKHGVTRYHPMLDWNGRMISQYIRENNLPKHLAIIMDGNGRWAKQKGLLRTLGHENGTKSVRTTVETCAKLGIENLTLYAFSTENWNRPKLEVELLMNAFNIRYKRIDSLIY